MVVGPVTYVDVKVATGVATSEFPAVIVLYSVITEVKVTSPADDAAPAAELIADESVASRVRVVDGKVIVTYLSIVIVVST